MIPSILARRWLTRAPALRTPLRYAIPSRTPARTIVIQAPGPSDERQPLEIVDASPTSDPFRNQHPYAAIEPPTPQNQTEETSPTTATVPATSLPAPPASVPFRPLYLQHPFDTHAFVAYLEKHDVSLGTARVLMEAVRRFIVRRGEVARDCMLGKEDMENAAYLFRAALNELRTELSVRTRNDGTALKAMSSAIRREVDQLEQKLKEDVQTLKHDIEMDMNNRKADTRTEMKGFDMEIEEINNKFTISLGDLRTEIESAKWDSVRRAISIIVVVVLFGVGTSIYYAPPNNPPPPPAAPIKPAPAMRDMSTSTDDELMTDEAVVTISEEKLEKLLMDKGVADIATGRGKRARVEKEEVHVDRI